MRQPHPQFRSEFESDLDARRIQGNVAQRNTFMLTAAPGLKFNSGVWLGESTFDHCSAIDGDSWLLVTENGAFRLNVATMAIERLWQVEPVGEAALGSQ